MPKPLKLAAVATTYYRHSHAQHIVDRFLEGYGFDGRHHRPAMSLASMYVDKPAKKDLAYDRFARYPSMREYKSVAEALTLGGDKLAVDGVLLIGEHGDYGRNEKGQSLYPRYELFKQIVEVFEASGRCVPVFNDKHFSWDWKKAKWMYDQARRLGFPMLVGSSLPVTVRIPAVDMPLGAQVEEAIGLAYGGVDSYDFHILEMIQCMVERRRGGETGVAWLKTYRGEAFWQAHQRGVWSRDLFESALGRSHRMELPETGGTAVFPTERELRNQVKDPIAYQYQHIRGPLCTSILLTGLLSDFNFAARLKGRAKPVSANFLLPMPGPGNQLATFFSPQCRWIERMIETGREPYPPERTLLTTGLTAAAVDSLYRKGKKITTPHLAIRYQPAKRSTFWRD